MRFALFVLCLEGGGERREEDQKAWRSKWRCQAFAFFGGREFMAHESVNKKIRGNFRQRPSFYSVPYLERGHQTSNTFVILGQGFG